MKTAAIALMLFLCGCSATWHLRRAMKKDPTIFRDTVLTKVDTVWRKVQRIDTVFKYTSRDTVVFQNKDSVTVRYYHSHTDSTIYIEAKCPDCPSVTKHETTTTVVEKPLVFWDKIKIWWDVMVWVLVLAMIGWLGVKYRGMLFKFLLSIFK